MKSENRNEINNQEEEIDIKKIIYLLMRQWHWFALFGALGLIAAYGYNKLTKHQYSVSSTILIPEKSNGLTGIDMKSLFQGAFDQPKNNIYNQIEIITSYFNISQTLSNLNWRTSCYKRELLVWRGIYKKEPFEVKEGPNFINPQGIAIYITTISDDAYSITIDGKLNQNGEITKVKYEAKGEFGRPFINEHFNFTLLKKGNNYDTPGGKYYFVFNDLKDITQAYQKRLKAVIKDKNSDIIECSIEGEEPNKEGEFLNELIKVYIDGKLNLQNEAQRRSLDFINTQLNGISDSLNSAGTKFTKYRSQNNIIDLAAEGKLVLDNLKEIETDRAKSQMQLDYFRDLLKYLNNTNDLKKIVSPSIVGIEDVSLNTMVLKLSELYNRRQIISFSATENNPTLLLIDKEMNQTRNQLNENLRNLIDNATRNINSQKERQADITLQLNKLPQKEQEMVTIQRQFDLTNEIYTFLLQKRAETNIALASSLPDVQIIDIARPETASIIGLSGSIILLIGFILGLGAPLVFILLINFFDDRIRTQEDVENHINVPMLGNIIHNPDASEIAVFDSPKSNLAESFRVLRTNMQFMLSGPSGKVISIHSNNPGEGKSFVSVNLATIMAMNNKKVLLIGADLRKPRLHKLFNLPNEHGLSTYLIDYDTVEQIIFPTPIKNLSVLPAGPIPPNPAELLSKPEMKGLIEKLRSQFDFIILDNAPVGLVTDGLIASYLCDLNVFILRYGVSHKHQIEIINQYAAKKTIENIAIVVNDIKTNAFGYTYYKYYQDESYQKSYYTYEDQGLKKKRKKKIKPA